MNSNLFVAGKSGNAAGRPKGSARSVRGMLNRFLLRELSPKKLKALYDRLNDQQKIYLLTQSMPFVISRETSEGMSPEQIEALYSKLEDAINGKANVERTA